MTIKVSLSGQRGFDRFHKVTLNGEVLETRFVSPRELEATIPPQAIKEAGTYPVIVVGEGDFASRSSPAYLIVSFKK